MGLKKYEIITVGGDKRVRALRSWAVGDRYVNIGDVGGSLTIKDNATISAGVLTVYGDITLCGSYNQTVSKTWTGKRTITDVNEPEYDNNVKSKYDL